MTIGHKVKCVLTLNFLAVHVVVELFLIVQTGEGLNFVVDLFEHHEEISGTFLVVWAWLD